MNSEVDNNQDLIDTVYLNTILKSQYRAALTMLRRTIELCPDDLWLSDDYKNRYWHIAYHTLFYTHLYAQVDEKAFRSWARHRDQYQFMGTLPWPPHDKPDIGEPYSRKDVLAYLDFIEAMINDWVDALDLTAPECGFWWYSMSKLEHQFNNLRHLQHHTGQLTDRLRNAAGVGSDWIGGMEA